MMHYLSKWNGNLRKWLLRKEMKQDKNEKGVEDRDDIDENVALYDDDL